MASVKDLYIGQFVGRRKVYIERCMAHSPKQAFYLLCKRIAKNQGVSESIVLDYFKVGKNCKVNLEIKFEEVD